jgi:signal transduction histidine kinase
MFMEVTSHRIDYRQQNVILALANNVTEKIQLEGKLEQEQIKKQQEITEAVITAQEKEREEIGGELHDNVNQILASARLYLGLAKRDLKEPIKFLEQTDNLIFSAIGEIRSLSHSLIPPSLNESELKEALENLVNMVSAGGSLKVHMNLDGFSEDDTSDKLKLTIYRIVQEQFNNILKHAKASNIYLTLAHQDGSLQLTIRDDGRGFDKMKKTEGVGLMNMRTRASLFNGAMSIESKPGDGCELKLTFV